jgi:hypothetical protein
MPKQLESTITNKVIKKINAMDNCIVEKNHGGPFGHQKLDLTGAVNGLMFQLEMKAPGNKPTPKQYGTIKKWQRKGVHAGWADSVEGALEFIKPLMEENR